MLNFITYYVNVFLEQSSFTRLADNMNLKKMSSGNEMLKYSVATFISNYIQSWKLCNFKLVISLNND